MARSLPSRASPVRRSTEVRALRRSARARWVALFGVAAIVVVAIGITLAGRARSDSATGDPYRAQRSGSCASPVLPSGQAHPSVEPEPTLPIWCYRVAAMPVTRVNGENSWADEFNTSIEMGRLNDGDMGYRIFNDIEHSGARKTRMFINQDHWMVDMAGGSNGGALLRPDRSFRFEQDRLVVEADVAAGIPEYEDATAVEIDITTAPAPTGKIVDLQYGYGLFGGHATFGCRFQADREMTCSLFDASGAPGEAKAFGNELGRVWQMLPFQHVGTASSGGNAAGENGRFYRACDRNEMDIFCRDRFRVELAKDAVRVFVNGHLYFEQSGLLPQYQLPAAFLDAPVYVYFVTWTNRPLQPAYRVHWDRIAINPRDSSGAFAKPSASPSFAE